MGKVSKDDKKLSLSKVSIPRRGTRWEKLFKTCFTRVSSEFQSPEGELDGKRPGGAVSAEKAGFNPPKGN